MCRLHRTPILERRGLVGSGVDVDAKVTRQTASACRRRRAHRPRRRVGSVGGSLAHASARAAMRCTPAWAPRARRASTIGWSRRAPAASPRDLFGVERRDADSWLIISAYVIAHLNRVG